MTLVFQKLLERLFFNRTIIQTKFSNNISISHLFEFMNSNRRLSVKLYGEIYWKALCKYIVISIQEGKNRHEINMYINPSQEKFLFDKLLKCL